MSPQCMSTKTSEPVMTFSVIQRAIRSDAVPFASPGKTRFRLRPSSGLT